MSETAETGGGRTLTIPEAAELRGKTEKISQLLQARLAAHLETLRPLFAPRRLLGRHLGGSASRDDVRGSDQALVELEARFQEAAGPPFVLKAGIAPDLLPRIENRVELYPWEYDHEASHGGDTRRISITSPVRWVMTYASEYSLTQLRRALAGEEEKRPEDIAQFVVNAVAMRGMIEKFPGLTELFADLRFRIAVETCPGLGQLPLVVLCSDLASFRPSDELILTATGFSGVAAFIELVDRDAVERLHDPLRARLEQALG